MKVIKITGSDASELALAASQLASAKQMENDGRKAKEAAREIITRKLKELRDIDVETLPEKETVIVQLNGNGGLKIDRKGSDRFDLAAFRVNNADLVSAFTKRQVSSYFESLT